MCVVAHSLCPKVRQNYAKMADFALGTVFAVSIVYNYRDNLFKMFINWKERIKHVF